MPHSRPTSPSRRVLCAAVALAPLLAQAQAQAKPKPAVRFGPLIDVAGRQRMLSQRIVKAYCQVGLGVATEASRAQLLAAVKRFDAQLELLSRAGLAGEPRIALARLSSRWPAMRKTALGPVERAAALQLATDAEGVLQAAQALVMVLQSAAGTSEARLVNLSGRQRMLSQRLAALYLLRAWSVARPAIGAEIDLAANEFGDALALLRAAPENTPEIARELEAVALQWEWFRGALLLQGAESHAHIVADASESILSGMEIVTARYAELSR